MGHTDTVTKEVLAKVDSEVRENVIRSRQALHRLSAERMFKYHVIPDNTSSIEKMFTKTRILLCFTFRLSTYQVILWKALGMFAGQPLVRTHKLNNASARLV